jgi:peroxiredoxin Q/BCP
MRRMKLRPVLALVSFLTMSLFASAQPLAVGAAAPQVTAPTETGAPLALGDVYAKQAYTLVYFYPKATHPAARRRAARCAIPTRTSWRRAWR